MFNLNNFTSSLNNFFVFILKNCVELVYSTLSPAISRNKMIGCCWSRENFLTNKNAFLQSSVVQVPKYFYKFDDCLYREDNNQQRIFLQNDFQALGLRSLTREILVNFVLKPALEHLSDPDFINQTIVWSYLILLKLLQNLFSDR